MYFKICSMFLTVIGGIEFKLSKKCEAYGEVAVHIKYCAPSSN